MQIGFCSRGGQASDSVMRRWMDDIRRMTMPIYLDYGATTPLDPAVLASMDVGDGNPHSAHLWGYQAKAAVEQARDSVAALIGAAPETIVREQAPPSPLAELWRDFRRNRGALIGLLAYEHAYVQAGQSVPLA